MKKLVSLLLLVPSIVLAQSNAQFAPPILPMPYQQMGNIYNGPGLGYQGYQGYAPAILPMMGQQGWNQQGWNQNGFNQNGFVQNGWNQNPFGQRPWGQPPAGYGQNNNSGSSMGSLMPLLAMGLGLFNAMNGQNEDQGDDWADNGDSTDDSSSNDNGYDDSGSQKKSCNKRSRAASSDTVTGSGSSDTEASAFTDTAAPTCRDCGRGVRRSTTARVRIPTANRVRIPQRSDSVDVAAGLQPASVGAPRVATGNHDDLVAASEDVPVTDPAPTGIVRHPAPKMRQQVRAGVSVPRREAIPTTRVVVTVHNNDERRAQSAPIWAPFTAALGRCAPGCVPVQYSAFGQRPHPTCHTQGRAIDVFGFNCGGHVYMAIDRGRYESIVQCMKTKMKVLYRNHPEQDVTSGHRDHGHFSMGCYVNGGHKFW